jgi:hypothetical protein
VFEHTPPRWQLDPEAFEGVHPVAGDAAAATTTRATESAMRRAMRPT